MIKTRFTKLLPEITPRMVDAYHERYRDLGGNILCKGGLTRVIIHTPEHGDISGMSVCNRLDRFNKKIGFRAALGRAMKKWYEVIQKGT